MRYGEIFEIKAVQKALENPHYLILIIGFILGCYFVLFYPPFEGPDEKGHFLRSWALATGNFSTRSATQNDIHSFLAKNYEYKASPNLPYVGYYLPSVLDQMIDDLHVIDVGKGIQKVTLQEVYRVFSSGFSYESQKFFFDATFMRILNPVSYANKSLAVLIVRFLDVHPLYSLYLGRFFDLILAYVLIFLSIYTIPFGKHIFSVLATLPSSVLLFSTVNYDSIIFPLIFLYIALIVKEYSSQERITKKRVVIITIIASLFLSIKFVYLPLTLLFSAIPKRKFLSNTSYYFSVSFHTLVSYLVALASVWMFSNKGLYMAFHADPELQIAHIIQDPFYFFSVLYWTIHNFLFQYLGEFIGVFNGIYVFMPDFIYVFAYCLLIFICSSSYEPGLIKITLYQRVLFFAVFFCTSIAIIMALYVGSNPVRNGGTYGMQARYFIPIFPLAIFFFYKLQIHRWTRSLIYILGILIIIFHVHSTIVKRYYSYEKNGLSRISFDYLK